MSDQDDSASIVDAEGIVKWFDSRKGFGFIIGPDKQDIFVHYTAIEGEGFRALRDGAKVRYNAHRGDTGWKATRVKRLEAEVVVVPKSHSRSPRRS